MTLLSILINTLIFAVEAGIILTWLFFTDDT